MSKKIEEQVFSLDAPTTFSAVVDIPRPGKDPAPLRLVFRHLTGEQLSAWLAGTKEMKSDAEWLAVIVEGWEGVSAEFSVEALAKLVNNYHAPAVTAIVHKFLAELTEVRRGN